MYFKLGVIIGCISYIGCANGETGFISDAGIADVANEVKYKLELVCGASFCGKITDRKIGITTDCGSCSSNQECGDNGRTNICGSDCLPLRNIGYDVENVFDTSGCDYALGQNWGQGYGTELQIPFSCNYTNINSCLPVMVPTEPNKPCAGNVCGNWWCCIQSDAGFNPFIGDD
jgi:hypothetical protein